MNHYDVIIIGAGAGGGTLAYALAPSGKRILLLERGGYVPREEDNWSSRAVFIDQKYRPDENWYDAEGRAHRTPTHYFVGGNTKFYGATLMRLREKDFGEIRHHDGLSPAWPIRYADLEPYYTRAEQIYRVRGQRGIDPTEPSASATYPEPPVPHEPRIQKLSDDLQRLGLHPFPLPLAIQLNPSLPRSRGASCIRCGTCGGFPCQVGAKMDAQVACVDPALRHPNVELFTHARVTRLETSPSGREVAWVHVERNGREERYAGNIVVLSAGAVNSAALLLRSACDAHPHGLANGSGVVGRHYMRHNVTSHVAISRTSHATVFQKTLGLNDFYFGSERFGHPMGNVQLLGRSDIAIRAAEALPAGTSLEALVHRGIDLCVISEDLPAADNRVTLDASGRVVVRYAPNNTTGHQHLVRILEETLPKLDCEEKLITSSMYVGGRGAAMGANHQCGTVRFGTDPRSSALDVDCKAHELDNLYVVDASFFVSSAAANPALTIIANALRVADHLLDRLR